jgi:hypothetical protein
MSEQIDINDICGDILNNGKVCGGHRGRIRALLEHFAAAGTPLRTICSARYPDREPSTIKRYCREFEISLADWVPLSMRPRKPLKTKPDAG